MAKMSWPWISHTDVVPFQSKEAGRFFGPWTSAQENRSSLLCEVITGFHLPMKQAWIVSDWQWLLKKGILCKALPFSESLLLLHPKTMHKFLDQAFCKTLSVCVCFAREWNNEMTSQSKLDRFSLICYSWTKNAPNFPSLKRYNIEGKFQDLYISKYGWSWNWVTNSSAEKRGCLKILGEKSLSFRN